MTDEQQLKNHWFQRYIKKISSGIVTDKEAAEKICPCPCCGYPTLHGRGGYEICELCFWEDDGQDDPGADEVWGLTEARENFRKYLVIYPPDRDTRIGGADNANEVAAKKVIVAAFDAMHKADDDEIVRLANTIAENRKVLDQEMNLRIRKRHAGGTVSQRISSMLTSSGISYSQCDAVKTQEVVTNWETIWESAAITEKERQLRQGYQWFRWHCFNYRFYPSKHRQRALNEYLNRSVSPFYVFDEDVTFCAECYGNHYPDLTSVSSDIYVVDTQMGWTMVFTHEQPHIGPYFAGMP